MDLLNTDVFAYHSKSIKYLDKTTITTTLGCFYIFLFTQKTKFTRRFIYLNIIFFQEEPGREEDNVPVFDTMDEINEIDQYNNETSGKKCRN